ncbi:hydroxyethylthiazole kinase [Corynebacterium mendelii]|uniref:Hydroxyethylthiazole kinase n=1 Tax=Corynebacterium mendelii TaxID=2765362 RepID=A0A939IT75_9CORY|nr:hydroxyethylthiazole kinase [Corynebacterium mendelii]MBN9643549.1 hydroxyethylthiazole kinase [Corynebacterium mendelii]
MTVFDRIVAACRAAAENPSLVQCLTNPVVPEITANVLLACGHSPAMCDNTHEAVQFLGLADCALINLGNPTGDQLQAMELVADKAHATGTPWVLDPVAVGPLDYRTATATRLLSYQPTAIRGNASEIAALAGAGSGGRGVDSTDTPEAVADVAGELARRTGSIVAVTGPQDWIIGPDETLLVTGGHPLMQQVVGTGCSLGALVAAYLGSARTAGIAAVDAVAAAHAHSAAAGTMAAQQASRPASFKTAWVDWLFELSPEQIAATATTTVAGQ